MKLITCIALIVCLLFSGCARQGSEPLTSYTDVQSVENSVIEDDSFVLSESRENSQTIAEESEPDVEDAFCTEEGIIFLNGLGGNERVSLQAGDQFLRMTLENLYYEDDVFLGAHFTGEVTLRGCLSRIDTADTMHDDDIIFIVAPESYHLLPYWEHDNRSLWFYFSNREQVLSAVGEESEIGEELFDFEDCEITIDYYTIQHVVAESFNSARFVSLKLPQ